MGPQGGADLCFRSHQLDTSLCGKTTDTGLMYSVVCLFTTQLSLIPSYTALWQKHMDVNNLPKVITRQRSGGWELNRDHLVVSPTHWPLHYRATDTRQ